jgi:hypothetical protein
MNLKLAAFLFCLVTPLSLRADTSSPSDVVRFIDVADTCLHLAGEWDNSLPKAQQRDIKRKVDKYCTRAKKQYRALLLKYKDTPDIVKRLQDFENVDSVSD